MRLPGSPTSKSDTSNESDVYQEFKQHLATSNVFDALDWLADTDDDIVARAQADRIGLVHEVVRCDDHDTRMHGIRRLRKLNANFGAVDKEGDTPLHVAVRGQDVIGARILLYLGASPNCLDNMGRTPLHWSASAGRITLTFALIDAGAWLHVKDCDGHTYEDLATPDLKERLMAIKTIRGLTAKLDMRLGQQSSQQRIARGEGEFGMRDGD